MRRIAVFVGGLVVLCAAFYGFTVWHLDRWYAQDFQADFSRRMGSAVRPGSLQVIELSTGGRLVCGVAAADGGPALYGVRYKPMLLGGEIDVLAAPGHGSVADEAYLHTACS